MGKREKALEDAVKELGVWLNRISHGGDFNPEIKASLAKARQALAMEKGK